METKQTAIEWLYEKMLKDDVSFYDFVTAMNMHRDEIINAFNQGWIKAPMINGKKFYIGLFQDLELAELIAIEARNKYYKEWANHS